jgi:hypothetical protein
MAYSIMDEEEWKAFDSRYTYVNASIRQDVPKQTYCSRRFHPEWIYVPHHHRKKPYKRS